MTREEIKNILLTEILENWKDEFDNGNLDETSCLTNDLGCDSLDILDMAVKIEDRFEIRLLDTESDSMAEMNIGELIDFVDEKLQSFVG